MTKSPVNWSIFPLRNYIYQNIPVRGGKKRNPKGRKTYLQYVNPTKDKEPPQIYLKRTSKLAKDGQRT